MVGYPMPPFFADRPAAAGLRLAGLSHLLLLRGLAGSYRDDFPLEGGDFSRMKRVALYLLLALLSLWPLHAQNTGLRTTAPAPASGMQIRFGQAMIPLTGPWKFHTGDDMRWADPQFDDSAWGTMDLTANAIDPTTGLRGFAPGWTARGYAGYSGYAWYRLRVNVVQENARGNTQGASEALAISMPSLFDDAYQVYVDGRLVGEFGGFSKEGASFSPNQPREFPLPTTIRPEGTLTIAIRMWMDASTLAAQQEAGGMHEPPTLGQASIIHALERLHWYVVDQQASSSFLEIGIQLLAILVVFGLYWLDHGERTYLWLGLICTISVVFVSFLMVETYTTWLGSRSLLGPLILGLLPVQIGLWLMFWGYWFRLERTVWLKWVYRCTWVIVVLVAIVSAIGQPPLSGLAVAPHIIAWLSPLAKVMELLFGPLMFWIAYLGIRKTGAEGWMALPAAVLAVLTANTWLLQKLHVRTNYYPFGVYMPFGRIAMFGSLGIITVLMVRRYLQGQRQREQWKLEMEQARQVQQLLVPASAPATPGFAVESVYLPAQQVGGDFFQVLPGDDGSLLIVVGDVSGKGLKAAMTVSTIVGALRGCTVRKPAEVLAYLNRVLYGQISGFATCTAALISGDGAVTLANAGNLAPYCNGKELDVHSGLPLGIEAQGSYGETSYRIDPGDRLTFVSDGVVEAANEKRELFGFARTLAISRQPAHAIAEAAKQFGQQDDISVLSVTRSPALKMALA
jgi:Stage II sporulation protein E (SpoIIE)